MGFEVVSPELALVDPELRAAARAALPPVEAGDFLRFPPLPPPPPNPVDARSEGWLLALGALLYAARSAALMAIVGLAVVALLTLVTVLAVSFAH
jgi:hypothetical protein